MSCTATSVMTESYEEPILRRRRGDGTDSQLRPDSRRRRRHSSYQPRPWYSESDNLQLLVDHFLAELGRRLDFLESYGHLNLDNGIEKAYGTLMAVREACSNISDGVMDVGRRRAALMVGTLEERYKEALATKMTLEQKAHAGVKLMESMLADFEARAYAMRDAGISTVASDIVDEGWRRMDAGLGKAKDIAGEGLDKARRAKDSMKEGIENAVERALERARERGLITYQDLPDPWRINPHILRGYRFHSDKLDCVRSVLRPSNEFFNIWSHAVGLLIVLTIAFYFYPSSMNFSHSTKSDVFIAAVFFFAAAKCLVCSTIWHTFNSIAHQSLMERFACIDYTGISLLVAASIMTTEYTAFYCEPISRTVYLTTTALLGIGGVILPWHPTFNRADMAWARVLFYVSLSATGALPVTQLILTRGLWVTIYFYAPITKSLLVYLTGAILYAAKIPERYLPGCFDYIGGSHNLWHLAVLGGILFHYHAMQAFFHMAFERAQSECMIR